MVCPTIEVCQKILQASLVELENKTKQVNELQKQNTELTTERELFKADRETWKNLYLEERKASQLLATANVKQQEAIDQFKAQDVLDKQMIQSQTRKIRSLKFQKYFYSAGSFGAGFATGYFVRGGSSTVNPLSNSQASGFTIAF